MIAGTLDSEFGNWDSDFRLYFLSLATILASLDLGLLFCAKVTE